LDDIRELGGELVLVGNGAQTFAQAFQEDLALDCPVLIDPDLVSYRAAGLRRGRVELLSPRLPLNAVRALRKGYRQTDVQGDPWQLGGVFVIKPGDTLTYRYISREAGDHAPVDEILGALEPKAAEVSDARATSGAGAWVGKALSCLVDPTIVFSFDRSGFAIHSLAFRPDDLDVDMSGKRCLVTGANSGIGYDTALALADLGAEVVLLCRSLERGDAAAQRIRERTGNRRVRVEVLDVSDLDAVRTVGRRLGREPVDVLVHNAGVLPEERRESRQGLELTFATHVAGPFLLTQILRPALRRADRARVVWVSSGGMYTRRLAVGDYNWTKREYDGVLAYAETKRMQVVLSEMMAERFGDDAVFSSMHPGWADTPSVRSSLPGFYRLTRLILRSPAEGADTVVWLAVSPSAADAGGGFYLDRARRSTHYLPFTQETELERARLWRLCARVTSADRSTRRGAAKRKSASRKRTAGAR
jgi:NAD(P)-dependent dehydrogenase (short-subunit alcohol dehydrogenase family)